MCLYVRDLRMPDGWRLQGFIRRSINRIKMRRAQVILVSDQGFKVSAIAKQYQLS